MNRRHLVALGVVLAITCPPSPAAAAVERQVLLVVTSGVSYQEALRDPVLRSVAEHGGIGLMTTSGGMETATRSAITISAGLPAEDAPAGPASFDTAGTGLVVDAERFRTGVEEAEPGLLGTTLAAADRTVGYVDLRGASGDPAMVVAMDLRGRIPLASVNTFPVLADLPPEFLGASAERPVVEADLIVSPDPGIVEFALERTPADEVLVLVVSAAASEAMRARGDKVTPLVLARGRPGALLAGAGSPAGGVSSETTRRQGVVSNVDVAPTVLEFLGVDTPGAMLGSPITVTGEPPTDLHRRYLEWREVVGPVGLIALGLALVSLFAGLVLIFGARRHTPRVWGAVAVAALASVALLVTLVPASLLPTFAWPVVLFTLGVGAGILTWTGLRLGGGSATRPLVVIALAGLAIVVVDVALGWRSGTTPLLGGSALDGVRFFGLGNPQAGIVLGGAVLGAARLRPPAGVALMVAASVFAGLPFLGADVGGAVTLAVAAALWYGIERWGRLGWRTWVLGAAAALVAVGAVVVTHRLLPPGETHVSRAVTEPDGVLGAVEVFWDRLLLNLRSTSEVPAAWLAVAGLPVWLAIALRPPAALSPSLQADARWQRAVVVLATCGIVGYVLNDTFGMAGITFVFVSAAVVFPALAARSRRLREPVPPREKAGG